MGPPGCVLPAFRFLSPTIQVCRIQISSHAVLHSVSPQEYAKPISKRSSFAFPDPYPRVLQPLWWWYHELFAKENIFSCDFFLSFFFFCGEWFLRMSFDIPFLQSLSPSLYHSILSSLSLSLWVSLSFWFFSASFFFLVSGSRPPLTGVKYETCGQWGALWWCLPAYPPDLPRQSQRLLRPPGMAFICISFRGHFVLKSMHALTVWP